MGRRTLDPSLSRPDLVFTFMRRRQSSQAEEVWGLALGPQLQPQGVKKLFRGTYDACLFHPRDLFRFAIGKHACSIILVHNHPSGSLEPSGSDLKITKQAAAAGSLLQIPLQDHIIITLEGFLSLRGQYPELFEPAGLCGQPSLCQ